MKLKIVFYNITTFVVFLYYVTNTYGNVWPKWMDLSEDLKDLGYLCETDNDTIGVKLGCDCKFPYKTPGTDKYADCSKNSLGMEGMEMPLNINVSLHVRNIIFRNNFITKLDENTFGNTNGVFYADFSRNQIQSVIELKFPRLTNLDLSYNQIQNLTRNAFLKCEKLQNLDLSFNQITFIEEDVFTVLKYLKILNLASNHIGNGVEYYDAYPFELTNLEYLEQIDLSNNSLLEFPHAIFNGTLNIKNISLKNNQILHIPQNTFAELTRLQTLDLSGNFFNVIEPNMFHGLVNLRKLMLNGNMDLTLIENHAFSGLKSLEELTCEQNPRLAVIDRLAFKSSAENSVLNDTRPKTVSLRENALTHIDADMLDWKSLEYLDLSRNHWICDCNLQWIAEFRMYKKEEASMLLDQDFTCNSPAKYKGMIIAELDPELLMCYSKTASIIGITGIILFCFLVLSFSLILILNYMGILPDPIKRCSVISCITALPKYSRVTPKSESGFQDTSQIEASGPDLEWDTEDMERYKTVN